MSNPPTPQITPLRLQTQRNNGVFADNGDAGRILLENRTPVGLSSIPPHVIKAFLATEDPRFYSHSGIDISGVLRAMLSNIRAGKVVQGGSSITQQLAKLLFLEPDKTLTRKIKEALIALQIERRYSKDEILALYLNQVYLGNGAYGVEAHPERYFGKPASQLTLAEGAMLAGLPAAPNKYSPINNIDRAYERRMHVLKRMVAEGFITEAEMDSAGREPIEIKPAKNAHGFKAPYFVEYVRQRLEEKYGSTTLYKGGLNVYTTLNLKMQEIAEAAMSKGLGELAKRHSRKNKEIQGAFLAIEPHSGYIKAMIGGKDFEKSEFNRSTQALRQPGSSFKPIVFAAALDNGFGPESIIVDGPVSYQQGWRVMEATNYENRRTCKPQAPCQVHKRRRGKAD
jgi:penicillin-binding protein 1A